MSKAHPTLRFALVKTLPILFSYFFISVAYGILLGQAGFSFVWSWFSSATVYTGAFQFVLATFLTSGASLVTVGLTALLMNSRQVFYGLSMLETFQQMGRRAPYMILTLTDETYSLYCSLTYPPEVNRQDAMFAIAVLCKAYWILGSVTGGILGNALPVDFSGMDFCLTALFVTVVLDQWRAGKTHASTLIGLASGVVFLLLLGAQRFILPALMVAAVLLLLWDRLSADKGKGADGDAA